MILFYFLFVSGTENWSENIISIQQLMPILILRGNIFEVKMLFTYEINNGITGRFFFNTEDVAV